MGYKIETTALAKRLQLVIGKIINTDQPGYIKGRFIGHNIILIRRKHRWSASLSGLKKAFDTVEWSFMLSVLKRFGFGDSLISWVNSLYGNTTSCANNCGWISKPFSVKRGIRQGCPLCPPFLFVIAEVTTVNLKANEQIRGMCIKGTNKEIKLTQFADDTTNFAGKKSSVLRSIQLVKEFGLRI